jgi:hypothetical protein
VSAWETQKPIEHSEQYVTVFAYYFVQLRIAICTMNIYQPVHALPGHDHTSYINIPINKSNWNDVHNTTCLVSLCNFVFHQSIVKYIEPILHENINTYAIDTKYMNYHWIKNNVSIIIVPDMIYNHTRHTGSLYDNTSKDSDNFNNTFNWIL